jgi:ribosomal-protein-alanine N-acetyltransferase
MLFKGSPKLETNRLVLRKILPTDYKIAYESWFNDSEQVIYTVHGIHKSEEVTKKVYDRWIEEYNDEKTMRWIIELKEKNIPIGMIDINNQWSKFSSVEPGYIIARKYWNKGYATEATKRVMKFLFEECELQTFYSEFMEDNVGSGKVMKKCGMTQEGCLRNRCEDRNGKRQNLISMSITRDEYFKK